MPPDLMVTDLVEINQPGRPCPPGSIILDRGAAPCAHQHQPDPSTRPICWVSAGMEAASESVPATPSRWKVPCSAPLPLALARPRAPSRVGAEFDLFSGIFRHEGAILEMEDPNWLPAGLMWPMAGTLRLTNASGVSSLHPLELETPMAFGSISPPEMFLLAG